MKPAIIIAIAFVLLIPISAFAEELEIEFTKFIKWPNYYVEKIETVIEARGPPNSVYDIYLYDKDGDELKIQVRIMINAKGTYHVVADFRSESFDLGIGYMELYEGSDPKIPNNRILLQKVDMSHIYEPQFDEHVVQIKSSKFIPNNIEINLGDKILFEIDCEDCYQLEIVSKNNNENLIWNKISLTKGIKFTGSEGDGIYRIADIFDSDMELTVNVIYPLTHLRINEKLVESTLEPETITQIDPPSLQLDAGPSDTSSKKIPDWAKNIFLWYGQDQVSEDELLNAIKYLINERILIMD